MSTTVTGIVTNGVIVPNSPLPEGAQVEIHLQATRQEVPSLASARITPGELRRLPREQRQAILAAAAQMAEQDYRGDKELIGFDAFSVEELDDDCTSSRKEEPLGGFPQ
jgi:hypothetical protein